MNLAQGFPPIAAASAHTLVLGSMPGIASLQAKQYYAHPRNLFWPFMQQLLGISTDLPYIQRCTRLQANGIALWDVLGKCQRQGSLDTAIDTGSMEANDFAGFLQAHTAITRICFNGTKAEAVWHKLVVPALDPAAATIKTIRLPSTSPANASISTESKLQQWRILTHE